MLARARVPDAAALGAVALGVGRLLVVALDLARERVLARMFGPGVGVAEDPATGSAAVALAVFLVDRGLLAPEAESGFTVEQGTEMGRPSRLEVRVRAAVAPGGAGEGGRRRGGAHLGRRPGGPGLLRNDRRPRRVTREWRVPL